MRWTLGTIVTASVVAMMASAFWPQAPGIPEPATVNAQLGGGGVATSSPSVPLRGRTGDVAKNAELEKKLSQPMEKVNWNLVPISKIISEISKKIKVDIVIDEKYFSDAGHAMDTGVALNLEFTKVTARTALEMAIERAGFDDVAITFRDGFIYLTSEENDRYIEVYNCRDLLDGRLISMTLPRVRQVPGGMGGGRGFFSVAAQVGSPGKGSSRKGNSGSSQPGATTGFSGEGTGPSGGGTPGGTGAPMGAGMSPGIPGLGGGVPGMMGPAGGRNTVQTNAEALISVIQGTVTSTNWLSVNGEGASIAEFNGLLIVTASHRAHSDIQQLLDKLRAVAKDKKHRK